MLSKKEQQIANSEAYRSFASWRNSFVLKMTLFNIGLVMVFDVLAIFRPGVLTFLPSAGIALNVGAWLVLFIIISVIFSAVYYNIRMEQQTRLLKTNLNELPSLE